LTDKIDSVLTARPLWTDNDLMEQD
jgi:hypothetical protein